MNQELVIRSTGDKIDICLRNRITGEVKYLYSDIEDDEWLIALIKDSINEIR